MFYEEPDCIVPMLEAKWHMKRGVNKAWTLSCAHSPHIMFHVIYKRAMLLDQHLLLFLGQYSCQPIFALF